MKILKSVLLLFLVLAGSKQNVMAQELNYQIVSLDSRLVIQKDYSQLIESNINVLFSKGNNGISWYLPYSSKTDSNVKILSITNGKGDLLPYKVDNLAAEKKLIIGDANKIVSGPQTYRIKYLVREKPKDLGTNMEIWWVGSGFRRDVTMSKMTAIVESPYVKIIKVDGALVGKDIIKQKAEYKLINNVISFNYNYSVKTDEYVSMQIVFEKQASTPIERSIEEVSKNKTIVVYISLLAAVMILISVLIRKRN